MLNKQPKEDMRKAHASENDKQFCSHGDVSHIASTQINKIRINTRI